MLSVRPGSQRQGMGSRRQVAVESRRLRRPWQERDSAARISRRVLSPGSRPRARAAGSA